MHHAFTSPVFRSIAVGAVLLVLTAAQVAAKQPHGRRLVLHAPSKPHALYLTAWRHGDVALPYEGDRLVPLTFTTRASVSDGCRWLATETLVPTGAARYAYRYDETLLECDVGATPCIKTPRTGFVTVEE